ncbi:Multidrug resistance protein fnx1, partial [Grifola frondosa]
ILRNVIPPQSTSAQSEAVVEPNAKHIERVGPLEITRSTRYGILAGIWVATFLSCCLLFLPNSISHIKLAGLEPPTCTFTPLYGRLCNVLGRRGANQLAVLFAALGTAACGFSPNMEMLIAARFLGGLGGGGYLPRQRELNLAHRIITSDMYSLRSRGLTQGVAAVFSSLGMGMGGPLGASLATGLAGDGHFFIQLPLFFVSFLLTSINLRYVTPGKSRSTKDVLKRIDYGGSATLLGAVLSILVFLSTHYSEEHPWSSPTVYVPLASAFSFTLAFIYIELYVAIEPVLAPFLLRQKIPVLVGISNFLVATCNFSVMYNFPTWFQTVLLTSASEAGAHLIPNGVSISLGSLFAGWMMHRTGRYRRLNLIFGLFPFCAAILLSIMREDSPPAQLWLSIIPLGFGNAVVLQTMLKSAMAVGTGFGQLFRGIGQVGGVAISAAVFQSLLTYELRQRISGDNAEEIISKIRHSATMVARLPPHLQRAARDSYAISLRAVFIMAACATLLAYVARLGIPDQALDQPRPKSRSIVETERPEGPSPEDTPTESPEDSENSDESENDDDVPVLKTRAPRRRLSTYESSDGGMDLESDTIGGSARR